MPKDIRLTEGFEISEDVPVPGGIRVPENIRVLEHFRVPEIFGYSTEKTLKLPDPTQKNILPVHL